jgi:hypothetical protein
LENGATLYLDKDGNRKARAKAERQRVCAELCKYELPKKVAVAALNEGNLGERLAQARARSRELLSKREIEGVVNGAVVKLRRF